MKHHLNHKLLGYRNRLISAEFTPTGTKSEFSQLAAKRLRKAATIPEKRLREALNEGIPYVFDFQVPIGPYVADFSSLTHQIIVEVDGDSHATIAGQAQDIVRTDFLQKRGFVVLRFANKLVTENMAAVLGEIRSTITGLDQAALQKRISKFASRKNPKAILLLAPTDGSSYTLNQMKALKKVHGKYREADVKKLGIEWPLSPGWLKRYIGNK